VVTALPLLSVVVTIAAGTRVDVVNVLPWAFVVGKGTSTLSLADVANAEVVNWITLPSDAVEDSTTGTRTPVSVVATADVVRWITLPSEAVEDNTIGTRDVADAEVRPVTTALVIAAGVLTTVLPALSVVVTGGGWEASIVEEATSDVVIELPALSVVVMATVVPPPLLETIEDVKLWSLEEMSAPDVKEAAPDDWALEEPALEPAVLPPGKVVVPAADDTTVLPFGRVVVVPGTDDTAVLPPDRTAVVPAADDPAACEETTAVDSPEVASAWLETGSSLSEVLLTGDVWPWLVLSGWFVEPAPVEPALVVVPRAVVLSGVVLSAVALLRGAVDVVTGVTIVVPSWVSVLEITVVSGTEAEDAEDTTLTIVVEASLVAAAVVVVDDWPSEVLGAVLAAVLGAVLGVVLGSEITVLETSVTIDTAVVVGSVTTTALVDVTRLVVAASVALVFCRLRRSAFSTTSCFAMSTSRVASAGLSWCTAYIASWWSSKTPSRYLGWSWFSAARNDSLGTSLTSSWNSCACARTRKARGKPRRRIDRRESILKQVQATSRQRCRR
jgi:hypothetical protein